MALSACEGGRTGAAYVREADGSIGPTVPRVTIEFVKEDRSDARSVTTGADGRYSIGLSDGRWLVVATHPDYEDYSSSPGFSVVSGNTRQTLNVFLRAPRVTTVFVVRHAEKADPDANDQAAELSEAGSDRARDLADALYRAGVTAVYATDFVRTKATVGPLADTFDLEIQLYTSPAALAGTIDADHAGDVVLVAGHSNTVGEIAAALGGAVSAEPIEDYDNVYVVTKTAAQASVVNLQYGDDSTPDLGKNAGGMPTLLLVQDAGASAGAAARLAHVAGEAGIAAIYAATGPGTVQELADALGLPVEAFDDSDVPAAVSQVLSDHPSDVVVIAATNAVISAVIEAVGGYPIPAIFSGETDNVFVVTPHGVGEARVLNLRY
jgi:broad specificity phosphatase PhoE